MMKKILKALYFLALIVIAVVFALFAMVIYLLSGKGDEWDVYEC